MKEESVENKAPRPRKRIQYTIAVIGSLISVVAMIMTIWLKLQDSQLAKYEAERESQYARHQMKLLDELSAKNDSLYNQLNQIQEVYRDTKIDTSASSNYSSTQLLHLNDRIETLEGGIANLAKSHQNLKRSLKPTEIEDLLTIPRLQDEVKIIRDKLEDLEIELSRRQTSFETSIRAESKSSNQSTNLILVVLIPLIVNFLYTVWKDLKDNKKAEAE